MSKLKLKFKLFKYKKLYYKKIFFINKNYKL